VRLSENALCELEGDDHPALSLLQRHARVTAKLHSEPTLAGSGNLTKPNRTWIASTLGQMLAPVQLSLSGVSSKVEEAIVSHSSHSSHVARSTAGFTLVFLPIFLIALLCFVCHLRAASRDDDAESIRKAVPRTASGQAASSMGTPSEPRSRTPAMTPLVPSLRTPVQHTPTSAACLLFPTMAADVRASNRSFDVYWGSLESPWFRADFFEGRLQLVEIGSGGALAASVDMTPVSGSTASAKSAWLVSNQQLKASTRGLAYRSAKDDSRKVRNAVAPWGSTVQGVNQGDGWLKVDDLYLPMVVDGHTTILEAASQSPTAPGASPANGLQITRGDGTLFASLRPLATGQFMVMRNGGNAGIVSIGTGGFLVEAKLPSGRRVATVAKEQVRVPSGEMMLELVVEPQMDAVIMLVSTIAALRQLPAHQG
jgi:hypothetical protein